MPGPMPYKQAMSHIFKRGASSNSPWYVRPFETLGDGGGAVQSNRAMNAMASRKSHQKQFKNDLAEYDKFVDESDLAPQAKIDARTIKHKELSMARDSAIENGKSGIMDIAGDMGSALVAGDWKQKAIKAGVVGGGWMALNGAGRLASGGTMGQNSSGQRDIMGIPLL